MINNVEFKMLKDITKPLSIKKTPVSSVNYLEEGYPFYTSSIFECKYIDSYTYDGEIIIINSINGSAKYKINYHKIHYSRAGNTKYGFVSNDNIICKNYIIYKILII